MDARRRRELDPAAARPVGWLRFAWRQLTSMRTALFLLLLLAIGAVPGLDLAAARHRRRPAPPTTSPSTRTLGPWLDRLGFFEVYASPWFAAIYLLLFVSLVGCVLPRTRIHWRAMRAAAAPRPAPARAAAPRTPSSRWTATRRGGAGGCPGGAAGQAVPRRTRTTTRTLAQRRAAATCARPATSSSTSR